MRKVVWAETALADFEKSIAYIARDNPMAAQAVAKRLNDTVQRLAKSPVGHIGRVTGTYEMPVRKTSQIISYALGDDTIAIVRIIHQRRDWKQGEWPQE